MMEIRRCTRADYPLFLDMANDAFGYGAENAWFQKHYGHCTPYPDFARDAEIGHHWLCFIDGELAGALGAYPFEWVMAGLQGQQTTMKAFGIGQVYCRPTFRNQGVMTALLQAVEKEMKAQGRILGYLTGDRQRYGRFGYDFGGNDVGYVLYKWRFGKRETSIHNDNKLSVRQATFADWQLLDAAYNQLPSRILRDERTWERQLGRANFKWFIGEQGERRAFMAYQHPSDIAEIYGDVGVAEAMLRKHIHRSLGGESSERSGGGESVAGSENVVDGESGTDSESGANKGTEKLTVHYPMQNGIPDEIGTFLHQAAGQVEVNTPGLFAVLDAEALVAAVAAVDAIDVATAVAAVDAVAVNSDEKKPLPPDTQMALARRLIGYVHRPLPALLAGFEKVTPVCLWISEADHI